MQRRDLTGERSGRLTAIRPVGISSTGHILWFCRCDCGNAHELSVGQFGRTQSCGCLSREVTSERSKTHGATYSKTHNVWCQMRRRYREREDYADRHVCDRWLKSFDDFLEDMGECPEGMSIDRIDNTKGYFPDNCRWATMETQSNNRKNNVLITCDGETLTAAQWSKRTGIQGQTIHYRINKGWIPHDAIYTPT